MTEKLIIKDLTPPKHSQRRRVHPGAIEYQMHCTGQAEKDRNFYPQGCAGLLKMENTSLKDIINYFQQNKMVLYERFGVTRIGIFGSFAREEQSPSSDIDLIVDIEGKKKNIHNFFS